MLTRLRHPLLLWNLKTQKEGWLLGSVLSQFNPDLHNLYLDSEIITSTSSSPMMFRSQYIIYISCSRGLFQATEAELHHIQNYHMFTVAEYSKGFRQQLICTEWNPYIHRLRAVLKLKYSSWTSRTANFYKAHTHPLTQKPLSPPVRPQYDARIYPNQQMESSELEQELLRLKSIASFPSCSYVGRQQVTHLQVTAGFLLKL
jgi:hypothetical protein